MQVKILQRLEDSNYFDDPSDPLVAPQPFTVGHRTVEAFGRTIVKRVDKFGNDYVGKTVDLPQSQGASLLNLGYAEQEDRRSGSGTQERASLLNLGYAEQVGE
jgi:hypothetical protein